MPVAYTEPGPRDVRSPVSLLWWLIRSQMPRIFAATALGTIWMVGLALTPYLVARAINDGVRPHDRAALFGWVGLLLLLGVATAVIAILRHRTLTKVRMDATFRTVHAIVIRSTQLGASLSRSISVGEVVTIGITDVMTISTSLTFVGPGIGAVIAILVVAGLLFSISPPLAVVILLGAPVVAIVVGPVLGRLRAAGSEYRVMQGRLTADMVDIVDGLRVLNGIGGKERYKARYTERSRQLVTEGYRVGAISSWVPALAAGLPMLFLAAVTWLGARMTAQGSMSVGDLVAVYGFVAVLVVPANQLIEDGSNLIKAIIASRRVISLWQIADPPQGSATVSMPSAKGELRDPESGVLVSAGSFVGLVSARGADALALFDRLGAFTPSAVTWDGQLLSALEPNAVHRRIVVADNEADIFSGSLREVLRGRGAAHDDDIYRALHVAAGQDIVDALPDGLDTVTIAQARDLSGGQRQRIRLARALLAEPEVLLAVEPTSAVDAHTEAAIARRLRRERAGRTTLVFTSSPMLLNEADSVIFLVEGRVCDVGRHPDLMARQPAYRELLIRGTGEPSDAEAPTAGHKTGSDR
jgi:ABC-type multidrug transport system fused ATPase/permease subunit